MSAQLKKVLFDPILLFSILFLLGFSIVIVSSASVAITEKYNVSDFYFTINQIINIIVSLIFSFVLTLVPIKYIEKFSIGSAFVSIICLILVFVPGLSRLVNGAYRWIFLGPISIQSAEFIKLLAIIYISGYLVRRQKNMQHKFSGVLVPLVILIIFDILLMLEPDFGTMLIVSCSIMGLLFIAGIKLRYLVCLLLLASIIIFSLIISSHYRLERIIAFLHPWDNQFDKGYQLVQSLIAFGRGGWSGVGLGGSVQKLLYLPEAYTDFIFAIIAEELGFSGAMVIITVFTFIIVRCFKIANTAMVKKQQFSAYMAYGISFWLALQTIINIGVNIGLLPTKGLTLPFISYGGSSLLSVCMAMAIMFRIDFELKEAITHEKS
jgi:cell division protein FtsW